MDKKENENKLNENELNENELDKVTGGQHENITCKGCGNLITDFNIDGYCKVCYEKLMYK